MPTGTVKWFNPTKGFGFIEPEDGSKDAFVHISAVERAGLSTLNEGQKVSYELQPGRDGKSSAPQCSMDQNFGVAWEEIQRCTDRLPEDIFQKKNHER